MANTGFVGAPVAQYFDNNGRPLAGGLVWAYVAGTDDLTYIYPTIQDSIDGTNPLANPYELDARGEITYVIAGPTKLVLEDANIDPDTGHGNNIWTVDNVGQSGTDIYDPNGKPIVKFTYVTDAVNEITISNAATGEPPTIEATGLDMNVDLALHGQGTGGIKIENNNTVKYMNGANTHYVGLKAGNAQATDITFTLPATIGSNLYPITSDGAGQLIADQKLSQSALTQNKSALLAVPTTTQSVPNNTITKVTLGTVVFDTNSCFAASTYTAKTTGYYQVNGSIEFATTAVTVLLTALIYKNGIANQQIITWGGSNTVQDSVSINRLIQLNVGDTIELYVSQNSGGARNISGTTGTALSIVLVELP